MSKPVKDLIAREYRRRYEGVDSACVVSVIGLDAISTNRVRGELGSQNIRLQVVKNSLARRAFADGPLEPLASILQGPCALVTGGESVIDVAKSLVRLQKTYPLIELKQGMLDGDPELLEVEQLARMKTRLELVGELALLIASPARSMAGGLAAPGGRIAGCLKAIGDRYDGHQDDTDQDDGHQDDSDQDDGHQQTDV
jgi:large subunit ribosomal protein L10